MSVDLARLILLVAAGCTLVLAASGVAQRRSAPPTTGGADVATQITFFQNNTWSDNAYRGPSTFWAWNQGNPKNPVSWAQWTGPADAGDRCTSAKVRRSGSCVGPFGQDVGSHYSSEALP